MKPNNLRSIYVVKNETKISQTTYMIVSIKKKEKPILYSAPIIESRKPIEIDFTKRRHYK